MVGFVLDTDYSCSISVVMVMVCVWKCLWHCLVWYDLIWVNVDRHFTVSRICEIYDKKSQITILGNQKLGLGKMNECKKCCSTGACGEMFGGT